MKSSAAVRHVAIIIDASKPYDRKVIRGVGAYAHQPGNWSLYVEEDPLQKLPDLRTWQGHGIIANFDDARVVAAVGGWKYRWSAWGAVSAGIGRKTKSPILPPIARPSPGWPPII